MIYVADLHIRHDIPVARVDNYLDAQDQKLDELFTTADSSREDIVVGGDFFDTPKPPHWLITYVMDKIKSCVHRPNIIVIPGQHDLPGHNVNMIYDSGLGILEEAGLIQVVRKPCFIGTVDGFNLWGCPFGKRPISIRSLHNPKEGLQVLVWHHLINFKKGPSTTVKGSQILAKFGYDVLLTGDNHQNFNYKVKGGGIVINPGSMMRMDVTQIAHRPVYYRIHGSKKKDGLVAIPYFFPAKEGVLDDTHIKEIKKRDKRIAYFVSKLRKGFEVKYSFKRNLVSFFKKEKVSKSVRSTILEHMEGKPDG